MFPYNEITCYTSKDYSYNEFKVKIFLNLSEDFFLSHVE